MKTRPTPSNRVNLWRDRLLMAIEGDLGGLTPSERAEAVHWQESQTHAALHRLFLLLLAAGALKVALVLAGIWPSVRTPGLHLIALTVAGGAATVFSRAQRQSVQGIAAAIFLTALLFVISAPGEGWPRDAVAALGAAWLLPAIGIPLLARLRSVVVFGALLIGGVAAVLTLFPPPARDAWSVALYLGIGISAGILLRRLRSDMTLRYRRMMHEARLRAIKDPLTGILNRHGWQAEAQAALDECARTERFATLVFLDLDHFKALNDTHGHTVGDQALRWVGRALDTRLGEGVAARIGGEEFALILPGRDVAATHALLRRVRKDLASHQPPITFSAGIAPLTCAQDHLAERMSAADAAMYVAKAAGRDQTVVAAFAVQQAVQACSATARDATITEDV